MKSNIFIPKSIKVGYQDRDDTYTKKLAYVIYYDEKGKLRKETSWNSWRNKEIEPNDFDNIETSGFVLNKNVGDYDNGWNHRHAYIRVYDPRGFEFEISLENLLYILENTNSIKGKGLDGNFVYGWDGKDLVLIPCDSIDYKNIVEYNNIVHSNEKISTKNLKIGGKYLTKQNEVYIYLGKYEYYSYGYEFMLDDGVIKRVKNYSQIPYIENKYDKWGRRKTMYDYKDIKGYPYGKHFWFAYLDKYNEWSITHMGSISNKIIKCVDDTCAENYADLFYQLEGMSGYSPYNKTKDIIVDFTLEEFENKSWNKDWSTNEKTYRRGVNFIHNNKSYIADHIYINGFDRKNRFDRKNNEYMIKTLESNGWGKETNDKNIYTIEELYKAYKPQYIQTYLTNGREYEKRYKYE